MYGDGKYKVSSRPLKGKKGEEIEEDTARLCMICPGVLVVVTRGGAVSSGASYRCEQQINDHAWGGRCAVATFCTGQCGTATAATARQPGASAPPCCRWLPLT